MLIDAVSSYWQESALNRCTVIGLGLYVGYWLWTRLEPFDAAENEPPYLPYVIPWVGHTLAVARNSSKVFERATNLFGYNPFTLKIAGQKHYVFTNPSDVQAVFKHSKELTFDSNVALVLSLIYGMKDSPQITVQELMSGGKVLPDGSILGDPHAFFRAQLYGEALEVLTTRSVAEIEHALDQEFKRLPKDNSAVDVPLLMWARNMLSSAVTSAVYGKNFLVAFPRLIDALWELDDGTYKLMYGIPEMFAKKTYAAREECVGALKAYLGPDGEKIREGGLPIILERDPVYSAAGVDLDGRARASLTVLQALHTNSAPTSFWLILYILYTPGLLEKIRAEVAPAYATGVPNVEYLSKQCPLYNSVWAEVLRLVSSTISVRLVDVDTPGVGGYTLRKGAKVFCPARLSQMSPAFWGPDVAQFKPTRFMERPQDATSAKMRPFGGGPTLCPGRHFASIEVKAFVAGALLRFDFEVPQEMPTPDLATPCLGIMRPLGVCKARVRRRADWPPIRN
ncbi:hypothetical protein FRC02_010722 [Tulasnella sp. 418]|nr:hypothetical protein FRC02_010722 [Tulasnella sp. 418]